MNFSMLKNMVENLVQSYTCPFCSGKNIDEKNIDIIGAAGNTVNIDMHCPSCNKHFMAKTEIMHMEVGNMTPEKLTQIQNSLHALKGKLGGSLDISMKPDLDVLEKPILDESIIDLRKDMQSKWFSASDLFDDSIEW